MRFLINQIKLYREKDPAIKSTLEVFLYPGFRALIYYKIAHYFYIHHFYFLARFISERAKHKTGIEIHPGATIGKNLFIDHGMGIVIGETTIIKDNVTIYHGVTLGATRSTKEKRHPTIENGVILGAHSLVLGNITVGENAWIGANAVVLKDVLSNTTMVGIPAHPVIKNKNKKIANNKKTR